MQHYVDYKFNSTHDRRQFIIRLYRGVATPAISESQYESIAQMLLLLYLRVGNLSAGLQKFDAAWTTESYGLFHSAERFDADSAVILRQLGRAALHRVSEEIYDVTVKCWLIQEADLLEEGGTEIRNQ